eukprot:156369_1
MTESIEQLQEIIETSFNKLEKKDFNLCKYLNVLTNKYVKNKTQTEKETENDSLFEEKQETKANIQNKNKTVNNISLLVNKNNNNMCRKGHSLGVVTSANPKKCNQCQMQSEYVCWGCYYYDKQYTPNVWDKKYAKYYWCEKCGLNNANKVKKILLENERKEKEIIAYYESNPHISVDLLCRLPNKISLEHLLKEIVVSKMTERWDFTLWQFDIDNFRRLNHDLGHDGADDKLKKIGEILRKFNLQTEEFWKKKGIIINRLWCFRQGGDEFTIVAKGKGADGLGFGGQIKTQFEFYKLLKKEINGIGVNISVGILVYGGCLKDCTTKNWLKLADNALYLAKKVKGKNTFRICDGMGNDAKGKVVKMFKDVRLG